MASSKIDIDPISNMVPEEAGISSSEGTGGGPSIESGQEGVSESPDMVRWYPKLVI